MIKVLNILTDSNIGGAGRCLLNYLQCCSRDEFDVSVILPRNSLLVPRVRELDFPVVEADGIAEKSFSMASIRTLKKLIREIGPDIVHTHGSLSGRIAARQCGTRVVYTRHSAFPVPSYLQKGPGHWLNGVFNSHYADQIIAVSPACRDNLLESGIPAAKITTMMNGVAPLTPASPERLAQLRKQLNLPQVFTAGILARLEPYKGHALLLEAAKMLRDEGRDFRILIGGSGPEEANILKTIADWHLEDRVLFLGFVENVSEILGLLDVQLSCSWGTEASSLSLIEGMSLGLATVASDYGGNPWQLTSGRTRLLIRSEASEALAARLRNLMDHPKLLHLLGENARIDYLARFTGEIFAENIESVYRQTILEK